MYKKNKKLSRDYQANRTPIKHNKQKVYTDKEIEMIFKKQKLVEVSEGYFMVESNCK